MAQFGFFQRLGIPVAVQKDRGLWERDCLLRRSVLVRVCVRTACGCLSIQLDGQLDGNEAGVDLVLIQLFLLSCVNHIVLMLTSIFQAQFYKKTKEVLLLNKVNLSVTLIHSKARVFSPDKSQL